MILYIFVAFMVGAFFGMYIADPYPYEKSLTKEERQAICKRHLELKTLGNFQGEIKARDDLTFELERRLYESAERKWVIESKHKEKIR